MRSFFTKALGAASPKAAADADAAAAASGELLSKAEELLKQLRLGEGENFPLLNEATRYGALPSKCRLSRPSMIELHAPSALHPKSCRLAASSAASGGRRHAHAGRGHQGGVAGAGRRAAAGAADGDHPHAVRHPAAALQVHPAVRSPCCLPHLHLRLLTFWCTTKCFYSRPSSGLNGLVCSTPSAFAAAHAAGATDDGSSNQGHGAAPDSGARAVVVRPAGQACVFP